VCGGFWERRRLDNWGSGKVVVEDSLSVGFEDGFGGHCEGFVGSLLVEKGQSKLYSGLWYADKNVKSACRTFLKVRNSIEQKDGFTEKLKLESNEASD